MVTEAASMVDRSILRKKTSANGTREMSLVPIQWQSFEPAGSSETCCAENSGIL